jgi:hypothetical protein
MHGGRLAGEARVVKRVEEPVAAAVAGEHPPRTIAPVGGGREPDQQQPRARITEPGQRARPIALAGIARRRRDRDGLAVGHQPRARAATDDAGGQAVQRASVLQSTEIVTRWCP